MRTASAISSAVPLIIISTRYMATTPFAGCSTLSTRSPDPWWAWEHRPPLQPGDCTSAIDPLTDANGNPLIGVENGQRPDAFESILGDTNLNEDNLSWTVDRKSTRLNSSH